MRSMLPLFDPRILTYEFTFRPYVCPYPKCGKAFKQSAALKNHSNFQYVYNNQRREFCINMCYLSERNQAFTCEQCQLNFFDKPTFNRHTREKHDLEFVFACSLAGCNKSFKRKSVLKAHMLDKHDILCNDEQLMSQRVSAGPYLKTSHAHKATQQHHQHSNSSPLPKIADLDFDLPPLNDSMYYLNPAMHGFGNAAPVLLNDPYSGAPAKPAAFASYNGMSASMTQYSQAPSACSPASYSSVLPNDFQMWLTSSGPNDAPYFNPALDASQLSPYGSTVMPSMTYSSSAPRTSPNSSFVYSSGSSGNSGQGRAGSFTPPTPYSRTASSSPISPSPASSPGRHSPSQEQAIPRLYRPKGTYY